MGGRLTPRSAPERGGWRNKGAIAPKNSHKKDGYRMLWLLILPPPPLEAFGSAAEIYHWYSLLTPEANLFPFDMKRRSKPGLLISFFQRLSKMFHVSLTFLFFSSSFV